MTVVSIAACRYVPLMTKLRAQFSWFCRLSVAEYSLLGHRIRVMDETTPPALGIALVDTMMPVRRMGTHATEDCAQGAPYVNCMERKVSLG